MDQFKMNKACVACGYENLLLAKFCNNCNVPFKKKLEKYDAFISYRRDGGSETARLVQMGLKSIANKNCFLDVDELETGKFDSKLLEIISSTSNFILILSPNCLDRCNDSEDWLTKEISTALASNKNIIPIIKDGFTFDTLYSLPDSIKDLPKYNALRYDHKYSQAMFTDILKQMVFNEIMPAVLIGMDVQKSNKTTVNEFAKITGKSSSAIIRIAREVLKVDLRTPSAILQEEQIARLKDFLSFSDKNFNHQNVKIINLGNNIKLELILIQPGKFVMGSPVDEEGHNDDEFQHIVKITKPFYISKFLISQGQYFQIVGSNNSYFNGAIRPVEMVSWYDAVSFCEILTEKIGEKIRLPYEAEWEYTCRAGTITPYSTGDKLGIFQGNYDSKLCLGNIEIGESIWATSPIDKFPPNPWGVHDMHGNVWEWCYDWYGPYPDFEISDPKGPENGDIKILRGGSWFHGIYDARSAQRDGLDPGRRHSIYGFRIIMEI